MPGSASKRLSAELMWLIGLAPTIAGAALAVDAYLRRASIALALGATAPVLGDVIGPTAWTQDAGTDVLIGAVFLLTGAGVKSGEPKFNKVVGLGFVAVCSVLICMSLAAIMFGWTGTAIWMSSIAGLAALFVTGQYLAGFLRGEAELGWLPTAGWLLIVIAACLVLRASTASLRKLDRGVLDRSFPAVAEIAISDTQLTELLLPQEAGSIAYMLGSDGSRTYFIRVEPERWQSVAVRDSDIASIRFRPVRVSAEKGRSAFTKPQ